MMGDHQAPDLRSIGRVVSELRPSYPDVTPSSLRFLEREGLVEPTRTAGGHRLYRPRDVERVRQIKAWQGQRLSLAEIRERLGAWNMLPPAPELAEDFARLAAGGDLAAASRIVLHADDLGMPLARVFQDVLTPALYRVGDRWASGDLLVGQEKEISELARDLIAELSRRHARPDPTGPAVVAACVEGERHDLGLRMVCALLRARGWRVHFLGADVAPTFLLEAVASRAPAMILLSAALESHLPALQTAIEAIATRPAAAPAVAVGGQIARAHADELLRQPNVVAVADRLDLVESGALDALLRAGPE